MEGNEVIRFLNSKTRDELEALVLAQGQTQGSAPRAHQQALATGPFGNTCEADAVSPEATMRGLQDKRCLQPGEYQVDLLQQQYIMHLSFNKLDLSFTAIDLI
jgi:hypothetical protein